MGGSRSETWQLDGRSGTAGQARDLAQRFIEQCGAPLAAGAGRDLLLVVSELVTNAVRHAPGPCTLALTHQGAVVRVDVSDSGTAVPVPRRGDLVGGGGGFGWPLVDRLAEGIEVHVHATGKTITARVPAH